MTNMATRDNVLERCEDIIKSENDDRLYRGLVLNNKMKVLLISDPTTDKCAAALNLNIGSMCDPDDLPGLAHFCQRMLLLRPKKYSKLSDYDNYLLMNGGISNAKTDFNHTIYYFDVIPTKLMGALKRFAQFFLTSLFIDSVTELELNAIHSEHLINMASDTWRLDQVEKSLVKFRHPYSKFIRGHRGTLDVKKMGINIRQRLLEFHEKYYSANVMSLCVLGAETLDELEGMVVSLFSQVRNKEIDISICYEHPFDDMHFRTKWYIVPIKNRRTLRVAFPIPDLQEHYQAAGRNFGLLCKIRRMLLSNSSSDTEWQRADRRGICSKASLRVAIFSGPAYYVTHLLTHKGEGSLLSALKRRGWCRSLLRVKQTRFPYFCLFIIFDELTVEGIKHVDDIITLVFQYINMLKKQGPVEWIYNEYRKLAEINFFFIEKQDSASYVSSRASKLRDYKMQDILCGDILFPQWNPEMVDTVMKCLTPRNIRLHVIAKAHRDLANKTECWYGTKYKKEKISLEIIGMWEKAGYNSEFHLPAMNEFIPSRLDLKPLKDNVETYPTIIEDTPFVRLWFKRDKQYLVPKAKMFFKFVSPCISMDPISFNLAYIYAELVQDSFTEYVYPAELAGLHWLLKCTIEGIILSIYGYDHKQHLLLEKILDGMLNLKIDPQRLEILKKDCINYWEESLIQQPYHQVDDYFNYIFYEPVFTYAELLHAAAYVTVDAFQAFIPQLFSKMHVECLIHGNMIEEEALDIARMIESKLKSAMPHIIPLEQHQLMLRREVRLDDGRHFLLQTENKFHKDSCTAVYYQIGMQSIESGLLLKLLEQIIEEPCFYILRTQEQLGHIVFSNVYNLKVMQGLTIVVQSEKHPRYVEQRIDSFIDSMLDYISTMSQEMFQKHMDLLLMSRFLKLEQLFDQTDMFWKEITFQKYNFNRVNVKLAYLKTLTQEQLLKFFKKNIHGPARRKLSLHITSTMRDNNESVRKKDVFDEMMATGQITEINDILSFKCSQSLYPALEPHIK